MATSYDIAYIGMGSAGLTGAPFARDLGASVAAIEKDRIGGDCTWTGCVPSKTLIKAARLAHQVRHANNYGLRRLEPQIQYRELLDHIRAVIEDIYQPTSPDSLRAKGMDVFTGEPHFIDAHTIRVGDTTISAKKTIIGTGAHPVVPPIPGLDSVPYLTYLNLWDVEELPARLAIIGAGPIGRELAQAYGRLGCAVTMLEARDMIVDDPDVAHVLMDVFGREGVDVRTGTTVEQVWKDGNEIRVKAGDDTVACDALLVATGRRPSVEGMDLGRAGVEYDNNGIRVDDKLQTSSAGVYAAGDCTGGLQFSHYAGWQGFMATRDALLPVPTKGVSDVVPWCIFTDPEQAQVGLTEPQARERYGDDVRTHFWPMDKVDRPRTESETTGFLKLIYRNNGTILGVTILAAEAGEMINEWVVAMQEGFKIDRLSKSIHAYPTYSLVTQQATAAVSVERALRGMSGRLVRRIARTSGRKGN